ncbi:MAG TPA: DUF2235 domain-containing protein [Ferruginibacter sp.]|jgi:hypothetical protein|nr:DUF2235 domain-containing protein [Ferruginibacter sp.]
MSGLAKIGPASGEQKAKSTPAVAVTMGMFFDGTMNNQNNTQARQEYQKMVDDNKNNVTTQKYNDDAISAYVSNRDDKEKADDSYENDLSNIGRISPYYNTTVPETNEKRLSIYIEGIGTTDYGEDSLYLTKGAGGAMGAGKTGIRAKVRKGCFLIAEKVSKNLQENTIINTLTFDVFGFSRGSAAARNFIYEATRWEEISGQDKGETNAIDDQEYQMPRDGKRGRGFLGYFLKKKNIQVNNVIIRFVGLFDTVSAYSPHTKINTNFSNDVSELHLDAISQALRIVHLTAADERRANFSLTTIESTGTRAVNSTMAPCDSACIKTAINDNRSIQLSLPGVHSDVGGCYPINVIETPCLTYDTDKVDEMKKNLIAQGWYTKDELSVSWNNILSSKRTIASNIYSYIPLHMMCKFGVLYKENALFPKAKQTKLENDYSIPKTSGSKVSLLQWVKNRLDHYAFEDNTKPLVYQYYNRVHEKYKNVKTKEGTIAYQNELDEQQYIRILRHKYLHWSSDVDSTANFPSTERNTYSG